MPRIRLRKFVIISLILHVIALFIGAVFFQFRGTITKPQLIKVGVISEYKDPGIGSGNSAGLPPMEAQKLEKKSIEPPPKEITNPEKKFVKPVTKRKQEKKISKKKEIVSQVNKSVTEQGTVEAGQNTEGKQTNGLATTIMAGMGSSKERGKGIGNEGAGLGTEGSGQGVEVGYPDYKINPKPKYPMMARRNGYEGVVLLRVWVIENGKVGRIELEKSSGYGILDNSALEAVKDWIFIPGKRNREPISSWVTVPIRFQLDKG